MMKIGIIGATGKSGSRITAEALDRGYLVVPLVRNANKLEDQDWTIVEKDLYDLNYEDVKGLDVVVDAFKPPQGREELHQTSLEHLIAILKGHSKPRLIVVGGAGSLIVDRENGTRLMDTTDFPDVAKPTAFHMSKALETLEKTTEVNWTYLSPSQFFNPKGERTGGYQVGTDYLLTNHLGQSEISYADYAIALVDEIENRAFVGKRFTVCSK